MKIFLAASAVAATAGASGAAWGQTFDGRVGFSAGHGLNAPLITEFLWHQLGNHSFQLAFGGFDTEGAINYGMFEWIGDITCSDPGVTFTLQPPPQGNRAPFTLNPVGNGTPGPNGITGIDSVRNPINITVPWPAGGPAPPPPTFTEGNNSFFNTYRFTVTLHDLTPRIIPITATGAMQIITGWTLVGGQEGDVAVYFATSFMTDQHVSATFYFHHDHIPAPGGAALLAVGAPAAARRRRCPVRARWFVGLKKESPA